MIDIFQMGAHGFFRLDVRLSLPAQDITVIRGPSGSGKTSLLRAIAGLDRHIGRIAMNGEIWQDAGRFVLPHKRRIGYVFQEASLFPHLDVRGNLDYARRRAPEAVDMDTVVSDLGMGHLLDRSVHGLSGGERQRVALARAMMAAPRLLLMDEPLSSLDRTARDAIVPLIRALGRRVPVIYVTHDRAEVSALADRVLAMADGRVTPEDLPAVGLDGLERAEIERLALAALRLGL